MTGMVLRVITSVAIISMIAAVHLNSYNCHVVHILLRSIIYRKVPTSIAL